MGHVLRGALHPLGARGIKRLTEGEEIAAGPYRFEVLETPGLTIGMFASMNGVPT